MSDLLFFFFLFHPRGWPLFFRKDLSYGYFFDGYLLLTDIFRVLYFLFPHYLIYK